MVHSLFRKLDFGLSPTSKTDYERARRDSISGVGLKMGTLTAIGTEKAEPLHHVSWVEELEM